MLFPEGRMLLPAVLAHVPGMPGTDSGRYLRGYQEAGNHCSEPYIVLSNLAIIPGSFGKYEAVLASRAQG